MGPLHTPTIMFSSFATLLIFGAFFGLAWWQERRSLELLLWSSAFFTGAIGFVLLAVRGDGYQFVTISLGNALAVLALSMIWLGLRAFDDRSLKIVWALAGPILWIAVTYFSDHFRDSVTSRIVLYSVLIFVYSALVAFEVLRSDNFLKLPSAYIVAFVFVSHGVFYLIRIPLILLWPLAGNSASGTQQPLWYQFVTFELFLHCLAGGFAFFALVKERTQQRYKRASETDALTGVPNRRAFLDQLDQHLATTPTGGAFLYLDIDHFKTINDRFGHAVGDEVLIDFADVVSRSVPGGAFVARLGGEEFAVCLPGSGGKKAILLANDIRAVFEGRRFVTPKGVLSATVSIGIAEMAGRSTSHEIICAADAALYAAKAAGRNNVWSIENNGTPQFAAGPDHRDLSSNRPAQLSLRTSGGTAAPRQSAFP
ncbi:GGDEF domain-containing protein [Ensifer sp.]|uniref:GGDEF domain-containing protein n=1 Tax=Ensifer sp. TaxID=1872086 RepID=UPI002E14EA81|nr:GGDEF domain-containing protein [Ensifer sp.]